MGRPRRKLQEGASFPPVVISAAALREAEAKGAAGPGWVSRRCPPPPGWCTAGKLSSSGASVKNRRAEDAPASRGREVGGGKRGAQVRPADGERKLPGGAGEGSLSRLLPSVGDAIFQPMSRDATNRRRESEDPQATPPKGNSQAPSRLPLLGRSLPSPAPSAGHTPSRTGGGGSPANSRKALFTFLSEGAGPQSSLWPIGAPGEGASSLRAEWRAPK